jgi:hypothetical protein
MTPFLLTVPRKKKTTSAEAEKEGQRQRCPDQPKEVDAKQILAKMNWRSACVLRGVEEGISRGSGRKT